MLSQSTDQRSAESAVGAWLYVDELAHRTMNDYAFMLASVDRASRSVRDPIAAGALADIRARLTAGVRAHRTLSPPRHGGARRLDEDLEQLCGALSASGSSERAIGLTLIAEPVSLTARRCWQACLIVSELVNNAMKHAFAECGAGEIAVDVRASGADLRIVVSDNGRGGKIVAPGWGTGIVNALTAELGGAIWRKHTPAGSAIILICPLEQDADCESAEPTPRFNGSREG